MVMKQNAKTKKQKTKRQKDKKPKIKQKGKNNGTITRSNDTQHDYF
jgi:hypothetical protein